MPIKGQPKVDGDQVTLVFPDLRQEANFVLSFKDFDGVHGSRQIHLKPKEDQSPELIEVKPGVQGNETFLEVIRKTKDGYKVTHQARIPFSGQIRDDTGLATVRYAYTLVKAETGPSINFRSLALFAGTPGLGATGPDSLFMALACFQHAQNNGFKSAEADQGLADVKYRPLPGFEEAVLERLEDQKRAGVPPERLSLQEIKEQLDRKRKPSGKPLLNYFKLDRDSFKQITDEPKNDFPLWKLELRLPGVRVIQPRYKMQLWVEAVDTDVDSEPLRDGKPQPHVSPSKEKFQLLVVSETELLSEIAVEEETLRKKLDEVFVAIAESEAKLIRENFDLLSAGIKPENLGPMAGRLETMDQLLDKQLVKSREVATDYGRILKELQYNQVDEQLIKRVDTTIAQPLNQLVEKQFDDTRTKLDDFRKSLLKARDGGPAGLNEMLNDSRNAGKEARVEIGKLKDALQRILDSMKKLTEINDLIIKLRAIEETEASQYDLIKKIKEQIENELLDPLSPPKKP